MEEPGFVLDSGSWKLKYIYLIGKPTLHVAHFYDSCKQERHNLALHYKKYIQKRTRTLFTIVIWVNGKNTILLKLFSNKYFMIRFMENTVKIIQIVKRFTGLIISLLKKFRFIVFKNEVNSN